VALFHRKDGKVVKEGDDLMAATRYAVMMLRYARPAKSAADPDGRGDIINAGACEVLELCSVVERYEKTSRQGCRDA